MINKIDTNIRCNSIETIILVNENQFHLVILNSIMSKIYPYTCTGGMNRWVWKEYVQGKNVFWQKKFLDHGTYVFKHFQKSIFITIKVSYLRRTHFLGSY